MYFSPSFIFFVMYCYMEHLPLVEDTAHHYRLLIIQTARMMYIFTFFILFRLTYTFVQGLQEVNRYMNEILPSLYTFLTLFSAFLCLNLGYAVQLFLYSMISSMQSIHRCFLTDCEIHYRHK